MGSALSNTGVLRLGPLRRAPLVRLRARRFAVARALTAVGVLIVAVPRVGAFQVNWGGRRAGLVDFQSLFCVPLVHRGVESVDLGVELRSLRVCPRQAVACPARRL